MTPRPSILNPGGHAAVLQARRIVSTRTMGEIAPGVPCDLTSASALVQVYDALTPENREKLAKMPAVVMIAAALKTLRRARDKRGAQ